jgi:predicted Zn-dependent protease
MFSNQTSNEYKQVEYFQMVQHIRRVKIDHALRTESINIDEQLHTVRVADNGRFGYAGCIGDGNMQSLLKIAEENNYLCREWKSILPQNRINGKVDEKEEFDEIDMVAIAEKLIKTAIKAFPSFEINLFAERMIYSKKLISRDGILSFNKQFFEIEILMDNPQLPTLDFLFSKSREIIADELIPCLEKLVVTPAGQVKRIQGTYKVILTPWAMKDIWASIVYLFTIDKIVRGISPLGGMVGSRIIDSRLSVFDDPFITDATGSTLFDDEGINTQRTPLIINGRVNCFISDNRWGKAAGIESTGNCFRDRKGRPQVDFSNIYVSAGESSLEGMLDEDSVIIVEANSQITPDGFYVISIDLGYLTKGDKKQMITGGKLSGNFFELLNNIVEISTERELVDGRILCPYIKFGELNIYPGS